MNMSRREFMSILGVAAAYGILPRTSSANKNSFKHIYDIRNYGNVRLLHITDVHAQLQPVYFREPNVNLGVGLSEGKVPHLVGKNFLAHFKIPSNSAQAHAFTHLNFEEAALHFGKMGGFAHIATLIKQLRENFGEKRTLLLDGGDTWQGSGTAYWTGAQDMVQASNLLGVDAMTGHWEFTYDEKNIRRNIKMFKGDFIAHNIKVKDEALFRGAVAHNEETMHAFKPYTVHNLNGIRVATIGQAFPYTPIANPKRFIPDWTFGIREEELQYLVNRIRERKEADVITLLSHNGIDVDLKMASRVSGLDVILGGHTHDAVPTPVVVSNSSGKTLVTNAGSAGKFVGQLDLDVRNGQVRGYRYKLVPVFSNYLPADIKMTALINKVRKPFEKRLAQPLATASQLLYRRSNFNGTFDQIICDALRKVNNAQIALSPGFRWGDSILAGQTITMEKLLTYTCITYPETYVRSMSGKELKVILEDVADNLFNPDPYLQMGGDMVRTGGLDYTCDPTAPIGKRISNMQLDDGTSIEAGKKYKVTGWATVNSRSPGPPIWDVVAAYLLDVKEVKVDKFNLPKLRNVANNPGLADYPV